jgi:hypothetical protein
MIRRKWMDPNKKFWATDASGREWSYFCYATSDAELKQRLEDKYLTVQRIEDYDFTEWKNRAEAAKQKAVQAYLDKKRPIKFNQEIWSELKWHLFDLFYGKCAYCESKPLAVTSGDVEHYRPKAKITGDKNWPGDPEHPGYYWLAYDINNLLPSCESCNRNFGKMNRFPVNGQHAPDEASLVNEEPLLLNPYSLTINPREHLTFTDVGRALAMNNSSYGTASIEVYQLNRPDLGEPRTKAIQEVRQDWSTFIVRLTSKTRKEIRDLLFEELVMGRRAYSAAQLSELERITQSGGL